MIKINSPGSQAWYIDRYKLQTGGINIDRLRRLVDREQPNEAVEVTISKEALALAKRLEKK